MPKISFRTLKMNDKSFLKRFNIYQKERFPIAVLIFTTLAVVLSSAAVVLSDEKNRKKLGKTVKNLTAEGTKTVNELKGTINETMV